MTLSENLPHQFDVIIIGSGAAGLYTALCLDKKYKIGIITKDNINHTSSDWAQGGIAAAIAPTDSAELHFQDTMKAGAGLCEPEAVKFLVENAASSIQSLLQMGVAFDRQGEKLAMTLEAAHSHPRVLHAADTTGKAILTTLIEKVLATPNIHLLSEALVLSLWLNAENNSCQGISLIYHNQISWIRAQIVILATGGGGQVFAHTTNPSVSTGDGVALAWRSGATIRDLEFFQFHPTALNLPGAPRFLISEAVRGEGGHLIDNHGYRFAFDYHPDGELAPRDIVSRAIFSHIHKSTKTDSEVNIYLDLRPIPPDKIRHRFPNIIQVCQKWGIDVFKQPIPIQPAAHYWMGGVVADLQCQTSIAGLYVVGEAASTGVHGANRLASNSLLECLVFASQLSKIDIPSSQDLEALKSITRLGNWDDEIPEFISIRDRLPLLMWENAGVYRTQETLLSAIASVNTWKQKLTNLSITDYILRLSPATEIIFTHSQAEKQLRIAGETLNLLDIGDLILKSALWREESRGAHYRVDYAETSSDWQVHTLIKGDRWWSGEVKM